MIIKCYSILCLVTLGACTAGKDSVILITKTTVAVDADTTPAALDIGYVRHEYALAPKGEGSDGSDLPMLTSIGTEAGALKFGADHSFATGEAAIVMAEMLTKPEEYVFGPPITPTTGVPADPNKVAMPRMTGRVRLAKDVNNRKRYFFGTNTSLGLHVDWADGTVPNAVSVGYKRKELAYMPLMPLSSDGTTMEVALPSLLATANVGTQAQAFSDSGLMVGQLFATGAAATLLTKHAGVRRVLGQAIIPNMAAIQAEQDRLNLTPEARRTTMRALALAFSSIKHVAQDADASPEARDEAKKRILELNRLDEPRAYVDFDQFIWVPATSSAKATLQHKEAANIETRQQPNFSAFLATWAKLDSSVTALSQALVGRTAENVGEIELELHKKGAPADAAPQPAPATGENLAELQDVLAKLKEKLAGFEARVAVDPAALDAVQFLVALVAPRSNEPK